MVPFFKAKLLSNLVHFEKNNFLLSFNYESLVVKFITRSPLNPQSKRGGPWQICYLNSENLLRGSREVS